jgi:hypothetical protein
MQLIICCDGTWNDPDDGTHIDRISKAARTAVADPENVFYEKGVGLEPGMRLSGGALGKGLSDNVRRPIGGSSVTTRMAPSCSSLVFPAAPTPHVRSPDS